MKRVKTIEYSTSTVITALTAGANRDLSGSTMIYIPETGITFKSVVLFVDCVNDITNTTAANLTNPTIGIILDSVAISTLVLPNPLVNSGEKEAWQFSRDVTSYFNTNWVGTGMTWSVRVNFTGMLTNNHAAKIIITYEYEDTSSPTAHIKTIRIPIESTRSLLTTSFQTVGGATAIPAIRGGYLPETNVVVRQVFLEMWSNAATNATTDFTWQTRISGGTAIDTYRHEAAMNSATWSHAIVDITNQSLLYNNSLECIVNGVTNRNVTTGGMIVVTYEYNPTTSTTIYNSLMLGAVDTSGWIGGTTSIDANTWERNIYIVEPGEINIMESGIALFSNDQGTYTFNVRLSGSTSGQTNYTSYVQTAGALQCGCYSLVHRIDSKGQNGNGIYLTRGKNLYRIYFYSNTAQAGWNLSGFLLLNYTSSKHSDGVGAHTHSVYQHVSDNITSSGSRVNTSNIITPSIPETYYNIIGYLFWINYNIGATTDINFTLDAEVLSTDMQKVSGWQTIYNGTSRSDSENINGWIYAAARTNFTRWNGDPDIDRLYITSGRRFRLSSGALWTGNMGYWYTYNSITYTVSGTCSGFSNDGSDIDIDVFRLLETDKYEHVLDLKTVAGGTFSGQYVNDTDILFVTARQDDTHVGRSANGIAG